MKPSSKYLLTLLVTALLGAAGFFTLLVMGDREFAKGWGAMSVSILVAVAFTLVPVMKILDEE